MLSVAQWQKIRFHEIAWMLEDEEWDEIFKILDTIPDKGKVGIKKLNSILKGAKKILEGELG